MSRDSVRYGRVPKRPRGPATSQGAGSAESSSSNEELPAGEHKPCSSRVAQQQQQQQQDLRQQQQQQHAVHQQYQEQQQVQNQSTSHQLQQEQVQQQVDEMHQATQQQSNAQQYRVIQLNPNAQLPSNPVDQPCTSSGVGMNGLGDTASGGNPHHSRLLTEPDHCHPYSDVVRELGDAYMASTKYTIKVKNTITHKLSLEYPNETESAAWMLAKKIWCWEHFAYYLSQEIQEIVGFVKKIPGFSMLCQDDQLILVKQGFFSGFCCQLAHMSMDSNLMFPDGKYIRPSNLALIFDAELASDLVAFTREMHTYAMSDDEIALYVAVIYMDSDRPGITGREEIRQVRSTLIEALRAEMTMNREHNLASTILTNLSVKLRDLKNMNIMYQEHLKWVKNNMDRVRIPALFTELFDLQIFPEPPSLDTVEPREEATPRGSPEPELSADNQAAGGVTQGIEEERPVMPEGSLADPQPNQPDGQAVVPREPTEHGVEQSESQ